MRWTRSDMTAVAIAWIVLIGFVVLVCVLLPTPPQVPAAPQLTTVMLDFFFGAAAIALASCVVSVVLARRFARTASGELERRLIERIREMEEKRRAGDR